MRVLLLTRQAKGGMATYANNLAHGLRLLAADVEIAEASDVIPPETGPRVDGRISEWLRDFARDFDIVHAIGLRSAWACSTTYGDKEAWVYSIYDMPKSTHRLVVNNLNNAQAGIAASQAVFRELDEALVMNLEIVPPGLLQANESWSREGARRRFGLEGDEFAVGCRVCGLDETTLGAVAQAMKALWETNDRAKWLLVVDEMPNETDREEFLDARTACLVAPSDFHDVLLAADLWLAADRRVGFSYASAEAMQLGTPVMLRDSTGFRTMVDSDISGFLYRDDDEMASMLCDVSGLALTLQSVSQAGKIRALDQFTVERMAERVTHIYERIVGE